jgi:MSHA type pilus biogenesis protein MshL
MLALLPLLGLVGCTTLHGPSRSSSTWYEPGNDEPLQEIVIPGSEPFHPEVVPERKLVSVAAREAEIRTVLLTIADQAGLNLVVDQDVTGTVSVEVRDLPVIDALDAIISQAGFHYRLANGLLRVYGSDRQTRIFSLDYVTGQRQGRSTMSATSGGMSGTNRESSSGGGSNEGSQVSINSSSAVDPWKDVLAGLESIMFEDGEGDLEVVGQPNPPSAAESLRQAADGTASGAPARRVRERDRLVVNPLTGVILVTASFQKLNRVADFLERVEGAAHRQVVIEAEILEITLSHEFHAGIDWSRIPGASSNVTSVFGQDDVGVAQSLSPDNRAFQIAGSLGDFDLLLDALAGQGRIKVLSSPRIATLNNQKAVIKVAREQSFFSQQIDYEMNPDGTRTPILTVEPQLVTIGLVLDVVPQIGENGDIMMNIHPSITELVGEDVFPPGASGDEILANAPILDIREVDTVVRVANGHMLVIGGLLKERVSDRVQKVPFLGDIPVVGHLFRRTDLIEEQIELVIAIRPRVVVGEHAHRVALREVERLRSHF